MQGVLSHTVHCLGLYNKRKSHFNLLFYNVFAIFQRFKKTSKNINKSSAAAEMATVATMDMGRKEGGCCAHFAGEAGPNTGLTLCGLGRGLLPHQVASSSIQPFGHNIHGAKNWVGAVSYFLWGAGSPSKTKSPGPRTTSIPSGILVHPAVWKQRILAKNCGLCPFRRGQLGPHLTQCRPG